MFRRLMALTLPLVLAASPVLSAGEGWRSERFNVVVRDQGIQDVLTQFGALVGVPVVISDSVDAVVSARFEDATGEQILEAIAKEYALDWRYDGRRIEVSSNTEQVSRILDMGGVRLAELEKALTALGAYEPRFPISAVDGEFGLLVGPPRYVAIVEVVLAELVEKRVEADRREQIRAAEERRLRELLARQKAASTVVQAPFRDVPLVNRGGKWGG